MSLIFKERNKKGKQKERGMVMYCLCKGIYCFVHFIIVCREDTSSTIRILVATDCHLGYMENNEIRRHDSFQAFEEICAIAEHKQVPS